LFGKMCVALKEPVGYSELRFVQFVSGKFIYQPICVYRANINFHQNLVVAEYHVD